MVTEFRLLNVGDLDNSNFLMTEWHWLDIEWTFGSQQSKISLKIVISDFLQAAACVKKRFVKIKVHLPARQSRSSRQFERLLLQMRNFCKILIFWNCEKFKLTLVKKVIISGDAMMRSKSENITDVSWMDVHRMATFTT